MNRRLQLVTGVVLTLALAATAAIAPAAVSAQDEETAEGKLIYVIAQDLTNLLVKAETDAAVERAEELGYDVVSQSHNNDPAKQLELFDDAIAKGAAAIVVDNAGADATVSAVQKAKDAGIPTWLIDREMNATGVAMAQIVANNAQGAALAGEAFAELLGEGGNYVEFTGIETDNNAQIRSQGFHSVIDQYPDLVMVDSQSAHWSQDEAFTKLQTILQSNPDIDGVINGNDTMALGAYAALKAAGKPEVVVVGFDGNPDVLNSIKAGEIQATILQPLVRIAEIAVDQADEYIRTGVAPAEERQLVDTELVTADNVDEYLALFE